MLIKQVVEAFQPLLFSPPKTLGSQHGPQPCWVVIKSFTPKSKNKGCFPTYFDVLKNFSSMPFVDWKLLKVGNRPHHRSVKLP